MAVGSISSPSAWYNGTVATATFFQNAQDTINFSYNTLAGRHFFLVDDFTGSAPDSAIWNAVAANCTTGSDDSAADGSGVLVCAATSMATAATCRTIQLSFTGDLYACFRVRIPSTLTSSANVACYPVGGSKIAFTASASSGNWYTSLDSSSSDSGVAYTTATYQYLEVSRVSNTVTFKINGTTVRTGTLSGTLAGYLAGVEANYSGANATLYVDKVAIVGVR
jgi:hypothetical protein